LEQKHRSDFLTAWNIEEWNIAFSQGSEPGTWKWTVHLTIRRPKSAKLTSEGKRPLPQPNLLSIRRSTPKGDDLSRPDATIDRRGGDLTLGVQLKAEVLDDFRSGRRNRTA
jgi:hypothetical protein